MAGKPNSCAAIGECILAIQNGSSQQHWSPQPCSISGQLFLDGKPLNYGLVGFIRDDGRASTGKLDDEGRFTLARFEANDGAVVGINHVMADSNR